MKQLDRIISNAVLNDSTLANHKLCKVDYALYMPTTTTLYFNDLTIEYTTYEDAYFIKTTYYYTDSNQKNRHVDSYFKLINTKRKQFIKSLLCKLTNKRLITLDHEETPPYYNMSHKKLVFCGFSRKKQKYNLEIDYIKPQYLDEYSPVEVSFSNSERSTMNQQEILKYLVRNVL